VTCPDCLQTVRNNYVLMDEADELRRRLRALQEQARWLLNHWPEPAFARQQAALQLARDVLIATSDRAQAVAPKGIPGG